MQGSSSDPRIQRPRISGIASAVQDACGWEFESFSRTKSRSGWHSNVSTSFATSWQDVGASSARPLCQEECRAPEQAIPEALQGAAGNSPRKTIRQATCLVVIGSRRGGFLGENREAVNTIHNLGEAPMGIDYLPHFGDSSFFSCFLIDGRLFVCYFPIQGNREKRNRPQALQ